MRNLFVFVLLALAFESCSFLYGDPMMSNTYYTNSIKLGNEKYKKTKELTRYDYSDENVKYFQQRGYVVIGYSALRYTFIGIQEAINAGCAYGATVLLYKHAYVGTASGRTVLPWYSPGDTYTINSHTSSSANAYGYSNMSAYGSAGYAYGNAYGYASGTGNSNTTTTITGPGSVTYYSIPYSNDYYDQYAIYMVKKYNWVTTDADVFDSPSTKHKKLGKLPKYAYFEVLDKNVSRGRYVKIKYGTLTAYIPGQLQIQ